MNKELLLIIGDKKISSWSLRAWLLLKHIGITFDEKIISLYKPDTHTEISKYSSSGKVPILIHNGNTIWDSMSIAEYLNEIFPSAKLWPSDLNTRAFARSICNEMHSGFINLRTCMPFALNESKTLPISDELNTDIKRIEQIWISCLQRHSTRGNYLFGDFCIADAMFAPVVLRFRSYNYQSQIPEVQDYCNTIINNPYIKAWISTS
jgi:glutathione S-transferase